MQHDSILSCPFLHYSNYVFNLGITSVAQHGNHIPQQISGLLASNDGLEDSYTGSPLALPILRVGVQSFEHIKGLG